MHLRFFISDIAAIFVWENGKNLEHRIFISIIDEMSYGKIMKSRNHKIDCRNVHIANQIQD